MTTDDLKHWVPLAKLAGTLLAGMAAGGGGSHLLAPGGAEAAALREQIEQVHELHDEAVGRLTARIAQQQATALEALEKQAATHEDALSKVHRSNMACVKLLERQLTP